MNSQKQRTEKQIEASRLNGARSKGPKTEEGKAKSSQNSHRHGFSDGHCLLYFNERDELYQEHLGSYTARFAPADAVESALVLRMVHADWRSRRADYMEAAMVDFQMDRMLPELKAQLNTWDQGTRIALGFQKSADNSRGLDLLVRYRAAADRAYDRALASLRLLQRDRLAGASIEKGAVQAAEQKKSQKTQREPEQSPPSQPSTAADFANPSEHRADAPTLDSPASPTISLDSEQLSHTSASSSVSESNTPEHRLSICEHEPTPLTDAEPQTAAGSEANASSSDLQLNVQKTSHEPEASTVNRSNPEAKAGLEPTEITTRSEADPSSVDLQPTPEKTSLEPKVVNIDLNLASTPHLPNADGDTPHKVTLQKCDDEPGEPLPLCA